MKANKIKMYVFDMGGVVLRNYDVEPQITEELQISRERFYQLAGANLLLLSDGKLDVAEFWRRFSAAYGREIREDLFGKYFTPELDWEMVEVINKLKSAARVVCGTNTVEPHFDYLQNRGDYQWFDAVYASNRIGVSKPDARFFQHILAQEGALPQETVFIDDTLENIVAADALGIKAIHFTDRRTLEEQIKEVAS